MGLFDKKYCDICGEKIGLLGNRKLEDGNLCKNCAKKLSPWFSDRRKSTVADIKDQLEWREENKQRVASFHPTQTIGGNYNVYIDRQNGTFTVAHAYELEEGNPDILDLSDVTGCNLDVAESRSEIMRDGPDGKKVSYRPPRYKYSYNFYCEIYVNNPFYSEIRFRLNSSTLYIETTGRTVTSTMGFRSVSTSFDPSFDPHYQEFQREFEEIKSALTGQGTYGYGPPAQNPYAQQSQYAQQVGFGATEAAVVDQVAYAQQPPYNLQSAGQTPNAQQAAAGPWFCPSCGSQNTGKFCENCGTPRPN